MCVFNGCRSRRSNVLDTLDSLEDKKKCDSDHSFIILVIMSAQVTALSPSRKMKRSGMIHSKELCGDNIEIRFTISDATLLIPLFSMCI